jgi:hypothetical protein
MWTGNHLYKHICAVRVGREHVQPSSALSKGMRQDNEGIAGKSLSYCSLPVECFRMTSSIRFP